MLYLFKIKLSTDISESSLYSIALSVFLGDRCLGCSFRWNSGQDVFSRKLCHWLLFFWADVKRLFES